MKCFMCDNAMEKTEEFVHSLYGRYFSIYHCPICESHGEVVRNFDGVIKNVRWEANTNDVKRSYGMKVYIAGKITGLPQEVYTMSFNQAEKGLKDLGFDTINPIKIIDPTTPYEEALDECFNLIRNADVIYLMPNWVDSDGAKREYMYAQGLGKIILKGGRT